MLQFSKAKKLCFDRQVHYTKDSTVSTKMPIYFYCNYADRWRLLNQYKQLNPSDVMMLFAMIVFLDLRLFVTGPQTLN